MKAKLHHGRIEVVGETEEENDFITNLLNNEPFQTRVVKPAADEGTLLRFYFKDKEGNVIGQIKNE